MTSSAATPHARVPVRGRALETVADTSRPPGHGVVLTAMEDVVLGLGLIILLPAAILAAGAPIAFVVWLVMRVAER
jgi:hypothetical protein